MSRANPLPAPAPRNVLLAAALPEEFDEIRAAVEVEGGQARGSLKRRGIFLRGLIAGTGVPATVCRTGDGAAAAARSLALVFSESPCGVPGRPGVLGEASSFSHLIGLGAAGALTPGLSPGDIVASARVVDDSGEAPSPDASLLARAVALGATAGIVVTTRAPMCSSKERNALSACYGVSGGVPAVVDMESSAWARAASSHGVPYLILRAVSDTLEENLPSFLSSCLDAGGSVDRAVVARKLMLHPSALPALLRMRERVRGGSARLASFLPRFLSAEA